MAAFAGKRQIDIEERSIVPSGLRRGACPTLAAPMVTGDGLLVRLRPAGGALSLAQFKALAASAAANGNGVLEITARGNLQIRGLRRPRVSSSLQPISTRPGSSCRPVRYRAFSASWHRSE